MKHIVILGGGHGGAQAAASLRERGFDGAVTLVSAEKWLPYQRPPLSKTYLKGDTTAHLLQPEAFYTDRHIDLRLGSEVSSIDLPDRKINFSAGGATSFDGLVYATGSRARHLPMLDGELVNVHHLKTHDDAVALQADIQPGARLTVVGGGFIGLEVAATARQLGCHVTVLEIGAQLMGRAVSADMAHRITAIHRAAGITIQLGTGLAAVERHSKRVTAVITATGQRIETDVVVVGVGAVANTELAERAGLEVANGVVVGADLATQAPNVVAIGDCTSFPYAGDGRRLRLESVQNATEQAKCAAATLLGAGGPYHDVPWFWSDQGSQKLQMAGLWTEAARSVVRGDPESDRFSVFHFERDRLAGVECLNRPADYMLVRRLLEAGITPALNHVGDDQYDLKQYLRPR